MAPPPSVLPCPDLSGEGDGSLVALSPELMTTTTTTMTTTTTTTMITAANRLPDFLKFESGNYNNLWPLKISEGEIAPLVYDQTQSSLLSQSGEEIMLVPDNNATMVATTTPSAVGLAGLLPHDSSEGDTDLWSLIPLLCIFIVITDVGNALVMACIFISSGLRQWTINVYLASLAFADLLVGLIVMPLATLLEANHGVWIFSSVACDLWLATDVMASTASILSLTAICCSRYMAVTRPFSYSSTNENLQWYFLAGIWLISAILASPIMLGVNELSSRPADVCAFYNADFLFFSSIFSFFIPSIVMIFQYVAIFRALNDRSERAAKRKRRPSTTAPLLEAQRKSKLSEGTNDLTEKETKAKAIRRPSLPSVVRQPPRLSVPDNNSALATRRVRMNPLYDESSGIYLGRSDSFERRAFHDPSSGFYLGGDPTAKIGAITVLRSGDLTETRRSSAADVIQLNLDESALELSLVEIKVSSPVRSSSTTDRDEEQSSAPRDANTLQIPAKRRTERFSIAIHQAAASIYRERNLTMMLAVVLICFLVCWFPFFSTNVFNRLMRCTVQQPCIEPIYMHVFIWLGYCNSMMNPFVYAIFHEDFRSAIRQLTLKFRSIVCCATSINRR